MIEKNGAMTFEDSPYIQQLLTILRDKNTSSISFRRNLVSLGRYMAYELTRTFPVERFPVQTPVAKTEGLRISMDKITIIVVLRAAIPFMEGVIKVFDKAKVGVISASRGSPPDFEINVKYVRVPRIDKDTLIILDPMIATGSTLLKVIEECEKHGTPERKIIMGVLSAPEGVERIRKSYSDVEIYVAAMDKQLNNNGYIVPGLGDAGDRAFNTMFE